MINEIIAEPRAGVKFGRLTFNHPALDGYSCPLIEVEGPHAGPKLCVMAGIHINEASSIQAATCIADRIDIGMLRGKLSIIPIVSTHNVFTYTRVTPPSEGRDLHWSYPGSLKGSFNDVLAHSLLFQWAKDADVLLDLHGGDIDEQMCRYVVIQSTANSEFDSKVEQIAACFDTTMVVALHPSAMADHGRCCTALARLGKIGLVAEAGDFGMADEDSVQWHQEGILRVAGLIGMLPNATQIQHSQIVLDRYEWLTAPATGIVESSFTPGQWIGREQPIGIMRDFYGRKLDVIRANQSGYVMMRKTTQFATEGYWIGAIAVPRGM